MNYLRKYLLNLYMYYYHYLHQKYKDEDVKVNKDKFENPCLYFFNYIYYNLFS